MRKVWIIALGLLGAMGLGWLVFGPGISPGSNQDSAAVESTKTIVEAKPLMPDTPAQETSVSTGKDPAKVAELVDWIRRALDSKNPADQEKVFETQLPLLVKMDPWAAAKLAESSPQNGEWRSELMRVVAQKWAESEPEEVGKWVGQLQNPDERDTMLSCACFQIADKDPLLALQVLIRQGVDSERREVMLGNLARQWASQDIATATKWARSCEPGEVRDTLFLNIAVAQSKVSPEDAASIVSEQITPGAMQEEAAIAVVRTWAVQDVKGAVSWAKRFPPGELRDRVMREISQISNSTNEPRWPR